jgi:hypothetical protein
MNNELAIETLQHKRQQLLLEKETFLSRINAEINSIESSIESLSGKKVWETEPAMVYDDENPDYIRQSLEEI